ncbi:hypothetical protein T440DRAFT_110937 [Plenodomus tracheiphilus IPT5]|uniref:Cysteine-rich transmembrane CYSTM domain-containing protein n=1 Tax=Plenodomus tracheiphilus IPT5 TaxID=1408161 RepID=A0A6A7B7P9_9PLEO|nr:hypothetical protein T440DRAFT_110937 [Plenodomus tracheiphilus IPT5]
MGQYDQGAPPQYPQSPPPIHHDAGPVPQNGYYNNPSGDPSYYNGTPNPYQQGGPGAYGPPQGQYGPPIVCWIGVLLLFGLFVLGGRDWMGRGRVVGRRLFCAWGLPEKQ